MKIGFDAREAFTEKAGKGQLAYHLLLELIATDPANEYFVFVATPSGLVLPSNFHEVVVTSKSLLWHIAVMRKAKSLELDVYFSPTSYIVPALASFKTVMIVHDMVAFLNVTQHQAKAKWIERLTLKRAVRKTSRIVTISHNSKRDLEKIFPESNGKVRVVYPAQATEAISAPADVVQGKFDAMHLPTSYILFVGTIEPRKNIDGILRAYALYKKQVEHPAKLVIAGKKGWFYKDVFALVDELDLQDDVVFTGFVDKDALPLLYKNARCFFFPSWYEGFGLIVLEAFSFGCPVITSNNSSLPEVAGDAAVMVDPSDTDGMARALILVTSDDAKRAALIAKGFEQHKKFSWDKNARETLAVIKEAYEQ